jgi:PE-PPE domain
MGSSVAGADIDWPDRPGRTGARKAANELAAKGVRSLAIALLAIGCAAVIGLGSTVSTAVTLLANAYVMGGTLMPMPNRGFVDMAIGDFINPTVNPNLLPVRGIPITYPASAGFGTTINESVRIGVANLDAAIAAQQLANPGQPIVVFGYSQSTVVSMIEKAKLEERKALGEPVPAMTFVGVGVGNRPHGGIATYLQGVTIPIVDFSFNGPAPTDPEYGFTTIDIAREYDGLADFPQYPIDLLADLNAVLGVLFVHTTYNQISLDPNSPKYVPGTTAQQYGDTTYYQIPTPQLPLFDLARMVGVPEKLIDVVEPVAKVIVDAGYDRTIPFGQPARFGLIPAIDPAKFASELGAAVGIGFQNALRLIAPAAPAGKPATFRAAGRGETKANVAVGAAPDGGLRGDLPMSSPAAKPPAGTTNSENDNASSSPTSPPDSTATTPRRKSKPPADGEGSRTQEHPTRSKSSGPQDQRG